MGSYLSGTVTILFTDIEGSTLLSQLQPEAMKLALARHHAILRAAIESNSGYVFQIAGDSFCAAFDDALHALNAALTAQRRLRDEPWGELKPVHVRMGLHTGVVKMVDGSIEMPYSGYSTLAFTQRIMSAAHGGQILLSGATRELLLGLLPPQVTLRDLGENRLKDLLHLIHLYQVMTPDLPSDFPPLKTLEAYPHNLPAQLTSFIGREKEKAEIKALLNTTRLITLTGSGGIGKTRLALEVAAEELTSYTNGVWLIELAPLTDPSQMIPTLAQLFGLREYTFTSLKKVVMDYLRDKKCLLILDNCEHLIEACARLADDLLHQCTGLKILATSREALGIAGEMIYRTPTLADSESLRLFAERARAVNLNFRLAEEESSFVAQICQRLDGIPLAIELAAARVNLLSSEQIAVRLDDRFRLLVGGSRTALPRQQTLRALIDWSYNLLSEKERTLFRRLAVFVGGWTLEAAEAVCSGELVEPFEVLDLMSSLVDKSLVMTDEVLSEGRYHRLETIRQYAREKFFNTDEVKLIRDRHLTWMLNWAKRMETELEGNNLVHGLHQVKIELDNIRSAIEWGLASSRVEQSMKIISALSIYWDDSHPFQESRKWLERGFESREELTKPTLIDSLLIATHLAYHQNDMEVAHRYAEECLELARGSDNKLLLAKALDQMAAMYQADGNFPEWKRYDNEARNLYEELGDKKSLIGLVGNEILTLIYLNDIPQAAKLAEDYAGIDAGLDEFSQAWFYLVFAYLKASQGDLENGTIFVRKSLLIFQQLNDLYWIANCLAEFAYVANSRNDPIRSARLLGARNAIHESIGATSSPQSQLLFSTIIEKTKSMLDEETFQSAWAEGNAMTMQQAIAYALENTYAA
ncbi:MAG: adenylate/guanylate cyclase domain-containing protein [Omnitrophica WOR_2 bacterium]